MILRRFMKHVSDQNWFAVGLDVLVVITGIFLGIQVANWNDMKQESERADLVLERLLQDFVGIDEMASEVAETYSGIYDASTRVIEFLDSDRKLAGEYNDAQFRHDLDRMFSGNAPLKRSPTYLELVSGGQMHLVRNEVLRTALASFDESVSRTSDVYTIFHDMQFRYGEMVIPAIVLHDTRPDGERSERGILRYDLEKMRSDPSILGALSMIRRSHRYNLSWQTGLRKSASDTLALLKKEVR